IQQSILVWLVGGKTKIFRMPKPLVFWGQSKQALLLSEAATELNLPIVKGLETVVKYNIDCRMFKDVAAAPYLGFVLSLSTANVMEMSVSELLSQGFNPVDKYVGHREESKHPFLYPRFETVGRVLAVSGNQLKIFDGKEELQVSAQDVIIE